MRALVLGASLAVALSASPAFAQQQQQPSAEQPPAGQTEQQPSAEQPAAGQTGEQTAGGADEALPSGFKAEPVLKTGETRDGDPIAYPGGTPEITSVIGTIEPGGRTPLHQHPVPVYVYILEGEVELETEGGEPHAYRQGEAYMEALNRDHQLFNRSDAPARVLVVFVGEQGKPTTVAGQ